VADDTTPRRFADVDPEAYAELIDLLRDGVANPNDTVPSLEERQRLVLAAEHLVVRRKCDCGDPVCRTYDFPGSQRFTQVIDFKVRGGMALVFVDERGDNIVCFERLFLDRGPMRSAAHDACQ
jgi:hypothetical protein